MVVVVVWMGIEWGLLCSTDIIPGLLCACVFVIPPCGSQSLKAMVALSRTSLGRATEDFWCLCAR